MKIIVDKEARSLLEQMCDVALKAGGIQNFHPVLAILKNMANLVDPVNPADEPAIDSPSLDDPSV